MSIKNLFYLLFCLPMMVSCGNSSSVEEEETEVVTQTPVSVTSIENEPIAEYLELNATSAFLKKSYVKASSNGYVQTVNTQLGQYVSKGKNLFTIITKEAKAIGNTINKLDPSFKFSGITHIRATDNGYISQMSHQLGDYVQDGEQLAIISNTSSFVFLLNLPYELHQTIQNHNTVQLTLPDGEKLSGYISSAMPTVDSTAQTQQMIIKVNARHTIPENLIAKVRIVKTERNAASSLPKAAVLSNETQDEFWVMKLINDTTAVKVPVKRGMETSEKIEILSPAFSTNDRIVLTGNYGLADTAKVKIVKQQ